MQIEWTFFQSKVARRIFLLFILSALIPVIFLGVFQILQLNRHAEINSQIQTRQHVKDIGMGLIGRLFNLDNQLNLLGRALHFSRSKQFINDSKFLGNLAPDFKSISIIKQGKEPVVLRGKALILPEYIPSIAEGGSWIATNILEDSNKNSIYILHKLATYEFLVGEVNQAQLWNFDLNANTALWVLDADNKLLFANTALPVPSPFLLQKSKTDTGTFDWDWNNKSYVVAYWNLFLHFRLSSKNWAVVLAEPEASFIYSLKNLYKVLIPTIFFAVLISMLLSQAQIRRYLIPLEQLRNATRRIAAKDFTTPVVVKSGDEFEELGDAFNRMATHLRQQFQTLSLLSVLDQSILKTEEGGKVLRIIFDGLKDLVKYDLLMLGTFTNKDTIEFIIEEGRKKKKIKNVKISVEEFQNLKLSKEITLNLDILSPPAFLQFIKEYPIKYLLIFPILHKSEPTALMILGFQSMKAFSECNTEELHDIFYRASVAFTHAEWEERLYHQAHYDDLTHLPNRLFLRDQLNQALHRGEINNYHTVVMFLDLDNFKDINDTLGHSIGDKFLTRVAQLMQNAIGHNGLIARIGGDEFTILIADLPNEDVAQKKAIGTAEKLLKVFAQPFQLNGAEFHVTASIGIVIAPNDSNNSDEIIKFADMSMYKAKEAGKNRYVFFSVTLEKLIKQRNHLLQELYTAITEEQFQIYFQPKINCKTSSVMGAEVLLRWHHPTRGVLYPDYFLPLAEESNLIIPLGEWVIKKTCQLLKEWEKQNIHVPPLAINISAKQFTQENLSSRIQKIINETGINPKSLEFEITESSLIGNLEETIATLNHLHSFGSCISIDDFGTGYSSMRYLQMLPLDNMKIDRIFVQGLPNDKRNISIIKAIITLAESLKLQLIAEGIETKEQSDLLTKLGCNIQQGFYFSEALPPSLFEKNFLKKQDQ